MVKRRPVALSMLILLAGCKPPPDDRRAMPVADAERGKALIEQVGCAACHAIPGIDWPKGQAGPALEGLADRAMIAGRVPNSPDALAAFVRNAPSVLPGTTMPAMPLSEEGSRDVAAYLYAMEGE